MPKTVCVVPSIRPESMAEFRKAWKPLFDCHDVQLVIVWDGDNPTVECERTGMRYTPLDAEPFKSHRDVFCRRTDAVRNLGFVHAAKYLDFDNLYTADDDCYPLTTVCERGDGSEVTSIDNDPIRSHLDALKRRVPLGWMNTAHDTDLYLRGVPYGVRTEAPVMLSHGVWVGTPDFDGETQLYLETCDRCHGRGNDPLWDADDRGDRSTKSLVNIKCERCNGTGKRTLPHSLPYYVGPIPRGVLFPLCGMNVMVRREALPYLYYAPMGADSGVPDLHRFADIFMGLSLRFEFDRRKWGIVTGYSTVHHTRASDARKNVDQERLGRAWMEEFGAHGYWPLYPRADAPEGIADRVRSGYEDRVPGFHDYMRSYVNKRDRYAALISSLLERGAS